MRAIDADAIHYVEVGKGVEIALASDIDKIPTLSPDDVGGVGKWVKNHDDVMWWWECSNCKEKPLISRFGDAEVLSAYCPRCGAKMEKIEDA